MLGILGGMGPMATVDFMAKVIRLTPATRDQDHIPMVAHSASTIPDRIAGLRGTGPSPLPAMLDTLRHIERAGATRIAIPCNTAHHWHGALQSETSVPILHIVDAVTAALARDGIEAGTLGLLATSATLETNIYETRLAASGFACRAPDEAGQAEVLRAIALVKCGRFAEAGVGFRRQVEALVAAGCSHVILACSEVPLALDAQAAEWRGVLIDATEALARACVNAMRPGTTSGSLAA